MDRRRRDDRAEAVSDRAEAVVAAPIRGARSWWILGALVLGLAAGMAAGGLGEQPRESMLGAASMIGGLWLNALKMTVVPLVVALLVMGIAEGAEAMRAGRIAARSMLWFIMVYVCSAIFGTVAILLLLSAFPLGGGTIGSLRDGLAALDPSEAPAKVPAVSDFFSTIIPDNAVAAAADGDVLQLVVFTLLFALAITQIDAERRRSLLAFFGALRDALLVLIGWVLWIAPIGIFALAFALAVGVGGAAVTALLHYILLVSVVGAGVGLAGYAIAVLGGRIPLGAFAKAVIAPQSVAISTRSSLASLPAMLAAARVIGVRDRVANVTLPMIGALLRPTSPAMNLAVVFFLAHVLGIEPSLGQIVAAIAVASVVAFGAVSIPGEVSFISTIAPIGMALGVPIAPLVLLVAVEMIPDIIRTVSNVTVDVAVTAAVDRSEAPETAEA